MGSFLNSLFDEIKYDLKNEIRSETRNLTKDTIDGVKDMLHSKKQDASSNAATTQQPAVLQTVQQPIQQPQAEQVVQQPTSNIELSKDDKVFGKSIDEYREIFQGLTKKHGDDIAGIYADPDYQKLDAETKEYINRVYMPTIEQSVKVVVEAENEYQSKMGDRVEGVQAMLDNAQSDGKLTVEEQNAVDKEAMKVVGEAIETMGNMAPKYLDKAGDIAKDLSGRIENKELADAVGSLGETLSSPETQQVTKDSAIEYSKSFGKLAEMGDTMAKAPSAVDETVKFGQEKMQEANNDLHGAAETVGMTQEDIDNAYNKGAEMSVDQATNNTLMEMGKLGQLTKNGGSEEEIKDATKATLESALTTFGSLFK